MKRALTSEKIIILDFGSQYTQLIARRIREVGVYSEILPHNASFKKLTALNPAGLIMSGGPESVNTKKALKFDGILCGWICFLLFSFNVFRIGKRLRCFANAIVQRLIAFFYFLNNRFYIFRKNFR